MKEGTAVERAVISRRGNGTCEDSSMEMKLLCLRSGRKLISLPCREQREERSEMWLGRVDLVRQGKKFGFLIFN